MSTQRSPVSDRINPQTSLVLYRLYIVELMDNTQINCRGHALNQVITYLSECMCVNACTWYYLM